MIVELYVNVGLFSMMSIDEFNHTYLVAEFDSEEKDVSTI